MTNARDETDSPRTTGPRTILDGVYEFDVEGRLTYANDTCLGMFGYPEDAALAEIHIADLISTDDQEPSLRDISSILAGETLVAERTFFRRDGSRFHGEIHAGPLLRDGAIVGVRGVLRDISRRKEAEAALRESEQRFRQIFELSPNAAALTEESSGAIVDVNAKFGKVTGYKKDELIGQSTTEVGFYSLEDRRAFLEQLGENGEVDGLPMVFRDSHGAKLHTRMFAKRMRIGKKNLVLTIFHDDTPQKRLEAQFFQAQKMEAIGTLATGIAHDFNNLLMGIQGFVSLMLSEVDAHSVLFSRLTEIEKQIGKGANLTRMLLGFARRGSHDTSPIDLNALVENNVEMFARAKRQLTVREKLQDNLWPVEADSGQMDQVLINLFVNAWQAMPHGGELSIETGNRLLDAGEAAPHSVEPGRYVRIRVQDSGCGMDRTTLEKIFEPFFTTKERGVGTGLGLASVYGIVKRHGGFITVDSEPGRGTVFDIFLPACQEQPRGREAEAFRVQRGSGTILLVDDDEVVRETSTAMLEKLGYRVLTAGGGAQAIEIYEQSGPEIDLVILDLVMPHIDGQTVFRHIARIDARQKVLFSTGCSVEDEIDPTLGHEVLYKPYSIRDLSRTLQSMLGPASPARRDGEGD
ncbi:MAG: PAS domain S-box protein [Deltaproteobacteria bacterium]|nr:PAS domain S-box protein [Deltaproteobacteria bacterium]